MEGACQTELSKVKEACCETDLSRFDVIEMKKETERSNLAVEEAIRCTDPF